MAKEYKYRMLVYPNITKSGREITKDSYIVLLPDVITTLLKIYEKLHITLLLPSNIQRDKRIRLWMLFFKQSRIGYKGRQFKILKFRTMKNIILKNEKLRLTPLGKTLRKTSLDELPQFVNVLRKDMSIVGPRPLPEYIEKKIKRSRYWW